MIKRNLLMVLVIIILCSINNNLRAQTVSSFENLSLPADTFWDGSDFSAGFNSGNAFFPNLYLFDSVYGGYWASGFAYSSMKDSITGDFTNIFSARPASGVDGSITYALGQQGSILKLTESAAGKAVYGFYITNNTYAAMSMRDGDFFAKKFGGTSGTDPDWFKITIHAYYNGTLKGDSVEYYLADYRSADSLQDYIITDWNWVDLTVLGNVDSLIFLLSSSDTGQFGMNTPPFFCIDNFITADSPAGLFSQYYPTLKIFPNPAANLLFVNIPTGIIIQYLIVYDICGNIIFQESISQKNHYSIDLNNFARGIYNISLITEDGRLNSQFIKN